MAHYIAPSNCYETDEYFYNRDKVKRSDYHHSISPLPRSRFTQRGYYQQDDSSQDEDDLHHRSSDEDEESEEGDYSEDEETDNEEGTDSEEELRPPLRSGGYKPEAHPDKIKKIILEVMEEQDLYPMDFPREGRFDPARVNKKSLRYYSTKGFAWFCCSKGHHRWPSAHSWCYLDLRKQRICSYRYQQQCKKCEASVNPEFSEEAVEYMAKYAVEQYMLRTGLKKSVYRGPSGDSRMTNNKPHDEDRCAKCKHLGRSCWRKF